MSVESDSEKPGGGNRFLTVVGWGLVSAGVGTMVLFNKSTEKHTLFSYEAEGIIKTSLTLSEAQIVGLFAVLLGGLALCLRKPS